MEKIEASKMRVFCVFQTFEYEIRNKKGKLVGKETYDILNAIFLEDPDAKGYINKHHPKMRKRMHREMWNAH